MLNGVALIGSLLLSLGLPHWDWTVRLAIGSLTLSLAGASRLSGEPNTRGGWWASMLAATCVAAGFSAGPGTLIFYAVALAAATQFGRSLAIRATIAGGFAFAGAKFSAPSFWYHFGESISSAVSRAGEIFQVTGDFGPSYLGLPHLAHLLLAWCAGWLLKPASTRRRVDWLVPVGVPVLWLVGAKILLECMSAGGAAWLSSITPWFGTTARMNLLDTAPMLALLAVFVAGALLMRDADGGLQSRRSFIGWPIFATAAGLVVMLVAVGFSTRPNARSELRIAFYENGLLDFRTPDSAAQGVANTGMFGLWKTRLENRGHRIELLTDLDAPHLKDLDVVVVINPKVFEKDWVADLDAFIRGGGTLIAIGDHTNIFGTQDVLNVLLEGFQCRLNFDSAMAINSNWRGVWSGRYRHFGGEADEHNAGLRWGLGGSLTFASWEWQPEVVLKYGFSDLGNRADEPSYLGNKRYEHGERLGDVVVAGVRQIGRGRMIVFGDTSSFQNVALLHSDHLVASQLFQRSTAWDAALRVSAIGSIVFASLGMLYGQHWAACLFVLIGGLALQSPQAAARLPEKAPGSPEQSRELLLDFAHAGPISLESFRNRSVDGLMINGIRAGYWPRPITDWRKLDDAPEESVFVIIGPRSKVTPEEARHLQRFVARGGIAVLAIGYNPKQPAEELNDRFGFIVSNTILGPIPIRKKMDAPEFAGTMNDIQMKEAWLLKVAAPSDWLQVKEVAGYAIAAVRKIGNGRLAIISDERFLGDENLEGEKEAWPANVAFFQRLLQGEQL